MINICLTDIVVRIFLVKNMCYGNSMKKKVQLYW